MPIVLPKDVEGILLLNIPSYMGGVDLWASGQPADGRASRRQWATHDDNAKQSFCDKRLEVRTGPPSLRSCAPGFCRGRPRSYSCT